MTSTRSYSSDYSIIQEDTESNEVAKEEPKKMMDLSASFDSRSEFWAKYPPSNPSAGRQAWLEDLSSIQNDNSNELVQLHPDVWSVFPRLDWIFRNLKWQRIYKRVDWEYVKDRYEVETGDPRRPWPQKGTGRARHKTTTSPIWIQGGKAHGNKGPKTCFTMLDYDMRVQGLVHTLSAKFAQDDVKFVKNLDIPTDDSKYIEELIDKRGWALSTLFVDKSDIFPANLTAATMDVLHLNMMPVYGLNVHDMLKHKNLVLTKAALEHLEEKLLFAMRRTDHHEKRQSSSTPGSRELPFHNSFGSMS